MPIRPSESVAVTVTTTTVLAGLPNVTRAGTLYYVDITAIGAGDTWTFKLQVGLPQGVIDLTTVTAGLTATGATLLALAAPFSTAGNAVPPPLQCIATRTIAGGTPGVTYRISMIAADT